MSPAETARPVTETTRAVRLLGLAVVATALGMAVAAFRGDGTSINAYLFIAWELPHRTAAQFERAMVATVLLLSVAGWLRPRWPFLLPVAAYVLADAVAGWHQRGFPFAEWAVTAHAPRYLAPVALILLAGHDAIRRLAGEWLLRVGLAVVFVVHGLEALRLHPWFVDLLISTAANLVDWRLSETAANACLRVIGVVDFGVAAGLVLRPARPLLAWAAFWGLVTAFSRMTANGWGAYPEVLMRTTHFLGPWVVWLVLQPRRAAESTGALGASVAPDAGSVKG